MSLHVIFLIIFVILTIVLVFLLGHADSRRLQMFVIVMSIVSFCLAASQGIMLFLESESAEIGNVQSEPIGDGELEIVEVDKKYDIPNGTVGNPIHVSVSMDAENRKFYNIPYKTKKGKTKYLKVPVEETEFTEKQNVDQDGSVHYTETYARLDGIDYKWNTIINEIPYDNAEQLVKEIHETVTLPHAVVTLPYESFVDDVDKIG